MPEVNPSAKPPYKSFLRIGFSARTFTGCTASAMTQAVNKKMKEGKYWTLVREAQRTQRATVTGDRDLQFCDCIVQIASTGAMPTYDVLLNPFRSWLPWDALSCIGFPDLEGITLAGSEIITDKDAGDGLAYRLAAATNQNAADVNKANGAGSPTGEVGNGLKWLGIGIAVVGGAYVLNRVAGFVGK